MPDETRILNAGEDISGQEAAPYPTVANPYEVPAFPPVSMSNGASVDQVLERVKELDLRFIRCEFVDFLGVARGRAVHKDYLPFVLEKGLPFARVNNTVDIDDAETDFTFGSQAGDFWAVPDLATFVALPYLDRAGHMFAGLVGPDGEPWPNCGRTALRRLTEMVRREFGLVQLGFEQEGYILRRREDGSYEPVHRGKQCTAEILDAEDAFLAELTSTLTGMEVPVEKMTAEGGQGMFEVNFRHADPLTSAERWFRFKHAFRAVARRHGYVGTFMPKPLAAGHGAGLHVHISCVDDDGADLLAAREDPRGLALTGAGRHFLGGLLAHAGALTALGSPSVNSYKRLQPGTWAPTHAAWGVGNRSALVRLTEQRRDHPKGVQRLELRSPDGTCNPYLLAGGILAAGLDGIRRRLEPGPPMQVDIARPENYEAVSAATAPLPASLDRALDALEADTELRDLMGPAVVDGFLKVKRIEWVKFSAHVTDWEYRHYTEFY